MKSGQPGALDRLFTHVYDDLRQVARQHLRRNRAGVLQATALVNAAYERLAARDRLAANDRRQFFHLLSRAMHDVLVEQTRADLAQKRGGGVCRVPLVEIALDGGTQRIEILTLQAALEELAEVDPEAAGLVTLRFYGGLTLEEAAEEVRMTFAVARRHWEYAKAWLHERLTRSNTR